MSLRALLAWPELIAQLAIFGTAALALLLDRDRDPDERFILSLLRLWRPLALVDLVFAPLLLLEIGAGMAGAGWRTALPLIPEIMRGTHAGHVWQYRLMVVAWLAAAAFVPLKPRLRAVLLLLAAAAILICESLTSHAIDHGCTAITVYAVHEIMAALWLGAVLGLWWGARITRLESSWVNRAAPLVSRLAGWTVLILILSGGFTAYRLLAGEPSRIFYAAYGRILLAKLGAASIVLLIGAFNRLALMPDLAAAGAGDSLVRNVGIESLLLFGVIYLAALLANTPPAH